MSKSDVVFIKEELDFLRKSRSFKTQTAWVELLICIKRKRYRTRQKVGWKFRRHGKKMKFFLMITPYARYDILLGAYIVDFSKNKPMVTESKIHIDRD